MGPAIFRKGSYRTRTYTPVANVSAGDVIVIGDSVCIAHRDIPANEPGTLATADGVYEVNKSTAASSAIADGKLVYWDATNNVITTTPTNNKQLGYTQGVSVDADATQHVLHWPA